MGQSDCELGLVDPYFQKKKNNNLRKQINGNIFRDNE